MQRNPFETIALDVSGESSSGSFFLATQFSWFGFPACFFAQNLVLETTMVRAQSHVYFNPGVFLKYG